MIEKLKNKIFLSREEMEERRQKNGGSSLDFQKEEEQ